MKKKYAKKKPTTEHPACEALDTAREIVADFATEKITDAIKLLPAFCASVQSLGWTGAIAGISGGAAAPVVACGMILGGTVYLKWKNSQREDFALRAHFGALAIALSEIQNNQNHATAMLTEIYERNRFVWTKIDGNDKQAIADKVTDALRRIGFDGRVTIEDLMGELREVRKDVLEVKGDTTAIRREQATKDDLTAMEHRILSRLEENKRIQTNPLQQEWPPELIEQAKILSKRGDKEQRAVAEIALKNHEAADLLIQELKQNPIAEAFRLLTLEGDNWYEANKPDKAIVPYEKALALRPDDITACHNVLLARVFARLGDIATHRRHAIDLAECTLSKLDTHSADWAITQNYLGIAWATLPTGDAEENTRRAIQAYQAALVVHTQDSWPSEWALTQNNLGNAWQILQTGDRTENLTNAIRAYEASLIVTTRDSHPIHWARIQNNLGGAWADMPTGNHSENLLRAIEAFEGSLAIRSQLDDLTDWATTQANLGIVWGELPSGDLALNRRRAIEAFEAVLAVRTRDSDPAGWARVQNSLGLAWANMPDGSPLTNFLSAINAYHAALTVFSKEAHPTDWAAVQCNLGTVWRDAPAGISSDKSAKAIDCFEAALTVYKSTRTPTFGL